MTVDPELFGFRAVIVAAANRYLKAVTDNEIYDPRVKELITEAGTMKSKGDLLAAARQERKAYDFAVSKVVQDPQLLFPRPAPSTPTILHGTIED